MRLLLKARGRDGDHIFAREFFLLSARSNLPQAPICSECNNEKSKLEHYLTAVLPFGGRHADASETLASMVRKRLEKNVKLHRNLMAGQKIVPVSEQEGKPEETIAIPLLLTEGLDTQVSRTPISVHVATGLFRRLQKHRNWTSNGAATDRNSLLIFLGGA